MAPHERLAAHKVGCSLADSTVHDKLWPCLPFSFNFFSGVYFNNPSVSDIYYEINAFMKYIFSSTKLIFKFEI